MLQQHQSGIEDYSIIPVPADKRKPSWNIAVTSCAWIISLSTLFTGGALAAGLTFGQSVLAGVFGMLILAVYGFFKGGWGRNTAFPPRCWPGMRSDAPAPDCSVSCCPLRSESAGLPGRSLSSA
ncbi:hypothetical protein [Paenibacillus cisolokensis]|uniref:hypothetical protein n=1 Tax=Paenibacillus cisolokensis TaxID=1658519 RepID=UPI001FD203EE|nr:hypothetical protein [Paenibacillus cisolokensis]